MSPIAISCGMLYALATGESPTGRELGGPVALAKGGFLLVFFDEVHSVFFLCFGKLVFPVFYWPFLFSFLLLLLSLFFKKTFFLFMFYFFNS